MPSSMFAVLKQSSMQTRKALRAQVSSGDHEHQEKAGRTPAHYLAKTPRAPHRLPIPSPARARVVPLQVARRRAEHRDSAAIHDVNRATRVQVRQPRRIVRHAAAGAAVSPKRELDIMGTYTEGETGIVMGSGGGLGADGDTFNGNGTIGGDATISGSQVVIDGDNVAFVAAQYGVLPLEGVVRATRYYRQHPQSPSTGVVISSGLAARAHKHSGRSLKLLIELMQMGDVSLIPHGADYHNFVIKVALMHNAELVSNYNFAVQHAQQLPPDSGIVFRMLESKRVPFGFFQGTFIPNPDPNHIRYGLHAARSPTPFHIPLDKSPMRIRASPK